MNIAIDVGGTKISAVLIAADNTILAQRKVPSIIHSNITDLAQYLFDLCGDWSTQAEHIGIACTGLVTATEVNFLSVKKVLPLHEQVRALFGLPVTILNDATAAAYAEYITRISSIEEGNIPDTTVLSDTTLVYMTVSTGIGAGIVQNGQLIRSVDGFCAHVGHVSVQYPGPDIQCHCGRFNCAEAIASGTAIGAQASSLLGFEVTAKDVFTDYYDHPKIIRLQQQITVAMLDLLANIKAITGAVNFVLGGSVGNNALFIEQLQRQIHTLSEPYHLTISAAKCGAEADLIGINQYVLKELSSCKSS